MYWIVNPVNARSGFALLLFLFASLLAFAQDSSEKRGGPDATDDAARRAAWFLRGRTVHGKSAADLLRRAHQQELQIRQQTQERLLHAAAQASQASAGSDATAATAPSGGVLPMTVPSGSPWVSLGPAPITALGRFGDASGRITTVAVDQNDSTGNTVYVGGAYGGVWKSTNAAASDPTTVTWTPLYDNDPAAATLAVGAVSLQPTNSSVILVGTGEPNSAIDSYYGMGILRSSNGGASWTLITSATGGQPFKGMGVSKFAWKPDGSVVVAGFSNATNEGAVNAGGGFQGIYYSTDAGATWTRATNSPDTIFGSVSDVVYNASLGKFFAALKAQGIYSSTNGSTWTRLAFQPVATFSAGCNTSASCDMGRAALSVRPGTADLYAWAVAANGTTNRGISKTSNGGTTAWTVLTISGVSSCGDTTGCGTSQGFYNLVLAAVPNSTNTDLFAGAVNLFKCSITAANPTCTAGGSWLNLTHVYGSCVAANVTIHPDQHAIDFLQANPNLIYFGNDGGAYRTLTGNTGMTVGTCNTSTHNAFQDLNTSSLGSLTQFISISHHPTDDGVILGGTQDNGSPGIAGGQASPPLNPPLWFEANGGDGGYNEIDQTNPNNWYTANTDVSIQKCTTGTDCIELDFFNSIVTNSTVGGDAGDFYTPYILDPQNQAKLLVGTCRVWRVNNDGTGATQLSNKLVLGTTTVCSSSESSYVYALAAGGPTTGNGSQVLYAGTSDGKIFVTTNADGGAATWANRTGSINPNSFVISKVALDTTDATGQTAYLTIMGFTGGGGHVFKTTNAGAAWTDISAGLPDAPADSIAIDPIDHTIVYVGTDVGVFATNDSGANWSEFGTGLPNVAAVALRTFNSGGTKKLRVGTHGRGVWETDLANGSSITVTAPNGGETWTRGTTQTITWTYAGNPGSLVEIELLKNGNFYTTISASTSVGSAGTGSFNWTVPGVPLGSDYRVRITSTSDGTITDSSNANFSVTAPPNAITVTAPNGGESWTRGTTQAITWTYTGNPGSLVEIDLLKQGRFYTTISASTSVGSAGAGSFNWTIPGVPVGNDYSVQVFSTSDASITDTSNANFTVQAGAITVTAPNGGESWTRGTTQTITWTYAGNPGSLVEIDLLKQGRFYTTISASTSVGSGGAGSFNWTIPGVPAGNDYSVQVFSTSDATVTDTSNANFTIQAGTITVTAPNGGENWGVEATQLITWTFTGNPGSLVEIDLLKQGRFYTTISASTSVGSAGAGSFNWTIPGVPVGNDYSVQVFSTSDASITDTSNANFTVQAGAITVTAPNGGESWTRGATQTVTWTFTGNPGSLVEIDLLKQGRFYTTISSSTSVGSAGTGSFNWTIPLGLPAGSDYSVQVFSTSDATITDTSNANFTVQ